MRGELPPDSLLDLGTGLGTDIDIDLPLGLDLDIDLRLPFVPTLAKAILLRRQEGALDAQDAQER